MAQNNLMVPPEKEERFFPSMDEDTRAAAAKLEQKLVDGKDLTDLERAIVEEYRAVTGLEAQEEIAQRQLEANKKSKAKQAGRSRRQEGGSILLPPEMSQEVPVDTYTPEDQLNAEATQVSDGEMQGEFLDFILDEALLPEEQSYLMGALEADPQLSEIFDKVVTTASEFTGEGEVEGPGTGVSDSIPARLSDGEFVMTQKATDQIGADNLQVLMDEAERAYDGGLQRMKYAFGGIVGSGEEELLEEEDEEIKKQMLSANQMPSVKG